MKKYLGLIILTLFLNGCAEDTMNANLYNYEKVAPSINLGDSKTKVLNTLMPLIADLPQNWKRPADQYMKDGSAMYIYYHRTGWVSDDRLTDDELTPFVFKDNMLVSIGWTALGGPKVVSSGGSASGSMTIYDPVRDSNAAIKRGQGLINGTCTLGDLSNC